MYGLLWRALPGPWPVRLLLVLVLLAAALWVCFTWVFPAIAPLMPFNDSTLQEGP